MTTDFLLEKEEIIETDKSLSEIMSIIEKHTDKYPPLLSFIFKFKKPYLAEFGDNYIHLSSTNTLVRWPFIELEMREFIKPRLKVIYQGATLFKILYVISILIYIGYAIDLKFEETNILVMLAVGTVIICLPFYAKYLQRKFREWLLDILDINGVD